MDMAMGDLKIASPTYAAFAQRFGDGEAARVWTAACGHMSGFNDGDFGEDPFRWALLVALGYECMSVDGYRAWHEIETPWPELRDWIAKHADLHKHTGSIDKGGCLTGKYDGLVEAKTLERWKAGVNPIEAMVDGLTEIAQSMMTMKEKSK